MSNATGKLNKRQQTDKGLLKIKITTQRKTRQKSEEKNDEEAVMECRAVETRDIDHDKRGNTETAGFLNVEMKKHRENQLDRT